MPVVLFHAGLYQFSGGFVGVDVFFVISGFLITTVIQNDVSAGRFSIYQFYERRVRRIFPALFAMLLVACILTAIISPPEVLVRFGRSVASSALFSSNIVFWKEASYFDDTMRRNAILHTWSLAVEEQFYVVYPILLYFLRRSSVVRHRLIVAGLLAASLAFALWATPRWQSMAFYLMPSRAWELMLGALLALGAAPRLGARAVREACATIGLLLIAWSVFTYSPSTPFPGIAALAPCLGAALLIQAGTDGPTLVSRALAWRPMVFIGLISYPLYLWHWPILVFARELLGEELRHREIAVCVLLSLALATASWLVLEKPIRRRTVLPSRRALFAAGAACLVAAGLVGGAMALSGGMMWRYPPAARTLLATVDHGGGATFRTGSCFITREDPHFNTAACLRLDPARPDILLLGDSHAAHLWIGMNRVFPEANILQATASGCRPFLGGDKDDVCRPLMDFVMKDFLPRHRVDTIVLAGSWSNDDTEIPLLPGTVSYLRRYADRVVVVGPINGYDRPLPELLANDIRESASRTDSHAIKAIPRLDARMEAVARQNGIQYLSLYQLLCPRPSCLKYVAPGTPVQFDKFHLSPAGSVYVADTWRRDGALLPPPRNP